ncbi:hypothetical protein [Kitasatospora sp. NPDC094016]|uniref:DUF6895 family protein n=1 Tax=Kitasatospora sp. NPDC094016 TaxID=3154986 RepID=UPI00332A38CD
METHLDRFFPPVFTTRWPVEIHRLCELSLILMSVRESRCAIDGGYPSWADRIARECQHRLSRSRSQPWRAPTAHLAPDRTGRAEGMLVFTALQRATGQLPGVFTPVPSLRKAPTTAAGALDFDAALAADLRGARDCRGDMQSVLDSLMRRYPDGLDAAGRGDLYDLTHTVFYATRFGGRDPAWSETHRAWAEKSTGSMAATRCRLGDYDLAAELTAAALWAGAPLDEDHQEVIDTLSDHAVTTGQIPPWSGQFDPARDHFGNGYHTTLTALAALVAADSGQQAG